MTDEICLVLTRCPETDSPVETVFRMRESAFITLKGEFRFRCARCGQVHAWTKETAWLETIRARNM